MLYICVYRYTCTPNVCVYIHVLVYLHSCVRLCVSQCVNTYPCVCMFVSLRASVCVRQCGQIGVCMRVPEWKCACLYSSVSYMCKYVCLRVCSRREYVCMCMCMHLRAFIHLSVTVIASCVFKSCACVYLRVYVSMCVYLCVFIHVHLCVCLCSCISTCTFARMISFTLTLSLWEPLSRSETIFLNLFLTSN